ncbi:MAG TPA: DUF6152 family protein [Gammaproteobacteria bacterium]
MNKRFRRAAAAVLSLAAGAAAAHHSFPAHYKADASVTLHGKVSEFLWRNPHAFIHLEVVNEAGESELWALEWHNTVVMASMGYSPDTLKAGDEVIVSGNPARDGTRRVRLATLERPADGFTITRTGGARD